MDLTNIERQLLERLPPPPQVSSIKKPTIIWIVEWLPPGEQPTGKQLHEWMKEHGNLGSKYFICKSKKEAITTLGRAIHFADSDTIPLLHIEAHGDEIGLEGPNGSGDLETLTCEELAPPLQQLNFYTRCNLVVFVAACTGFAGIKVFFRGPLAPAVALVGPIALISPSDLLQGTKEFYRRLRGDQPHLDQMVGRASREAGRVAFELEPFVILAFEAFAGQYIISKRPEQQRLQVDRIRKMMLAKTTYSAEEVELRLPQNPALLLENRKQHLQPIWDKMFMIDLFPNNQQKFGVDWSNVIDMVERDR